MESDTILVLDKGRLADMGTHEELIRRDGIYKDIYDVQMNLAEDIEWIITKKKAIGPSI